MKTSRFATSAASASWLSPGWAAARGLRPAAAKTASVAREDRNEGISLKVNVYLGFW